MFQLGQKVSKTHLPLTQAASVGDLDEVRRLLKAGHEVDERGDPLTKDELKSVRWLLNEVGVNEAAGAFDRPFDYTPLMAAIAEGHFEVAHALLDAGADVNATDSLKRTPLMLAIGWKQAELAERLVAAGADVDAKDTCGEPVLTQAINQNAWEIIDRLLDAGANPDPKAKIDSVPLVAISYNSQPQAKAVLKKLLDLGAEPRNTLPLVCALGEGELDLVRRLVELGSPLECEYWLHDPLYQAASHGNREAIRYLLSRGAQLSEKRDEKGILCFMTLLPEGEATQTSEALIKAGADLEHVDRNGYTPLHSAAEHARPDLARWLLERGVNPNRCEYGECTPIDVALRELGFCKTHVQNKRRSRSQNHEQIGRWQRLIDEIPKTIAVLEEFGGRRADDSMRSANQQSPILSTPPAERRGLCDATFFKGYQVMIKADIDKIATLLEKDRKFVRVERDVYSRLSELEPPVGDVLALVKLRGQPWVYLAGCHRPHGDSPMQAWSRKLNRPVLYAGEESVASVVFYALYDRGQCVEAFESDGMWFRGGVEIDPDIQDESDRMHGTTFSSLLRDADEIDWSAYESEWGFLDNFLREQDAYLTFMWAGPATEGGPLEIRAYHDDEATAESIERVDLTYYQPTAQQQRAAAAPQAEDPLYEAIKAGDVDAVKQLLDAGVDLNKLPPRNDQSYLVIALGCALYNRSQEIVDLLLESGADPNFSGQEPSVPRLMAWSSRSTDLMVMLLKLLAAGADVNGRKAGDKSNPFAPGGQTALHKAAQSGQINFVKLLLRHGADASIVDGAGRTPLDAARAWLKSVKQDRIKDVPSFTSELHVPLAQQTVESLESLERGELDVTTLPNDEELLAAEEQLQAERHRVELEEL